MEKFEQNAVRFVDAREGHFLINIQPFNGLLYDLGFGPILVVVGGTLWQSVWFTDFEFSDIEFKDPASLFFGISMVRDLLGLAQISFVGSRLRLWRCLTTLCQEIHVTENVLASSWKEGAILK